MKSKETRNNCDVSAEQKLISDGRSEWEGRCRENK
jgi:hypothetical protein